MIHNPFGFRPRNFANIFDTMIVYLVGFMGSGKSYAGKVLADKLNVPHIDLDEWIENHFGKSVKEIFASDGELGFRQKETFALTELYRTFVTKGNITSKCALPELVISTGGGTPCFNENMDWMNEHGLTIWLNPSIETLISRLENEKDHRPLISGLSNEELKKFIEHKMKERSPYYSKALLKLENENIDFVTLLNNIKHA